MVHQYEPYDKELTELKETILKMAVLVKELIHKAVESLKSYERYLAKEVIKRDVEVDQLELQIDEKCLSLIALRQPKASDLRFITTGMRIATDLERIGDLAEDIAERGLEISDQPLLKPLDDIPKMGKLAEDSLALAIDSFINSDPNKARQLWAKEKESDRLRDLVHDELLSIMEKDCSTVRRGIPLLLVSRHLERICDHIVNIAEDVVFMVEAKVIKHTERKE